MNGGRSAAVCSPNLMQRLSHLPTPPDVGPLRRRYLSPFPLCHKHHLESNPNFRWCCIDLLNAHDFSDKWLTRLAKNGVIGNTQSNFGEISVLPEFADGLIGNIAQSGSCHGRGRLHPPSLW